MITVLNPQSPWTLDRVAPPTVATCVVVSWDEWCEVSDAIGEGERVATDLIRYADAPETGPVNLWDPGRRVWMILTREDAMTPLRTRTRQPRRAACDIDDDERDD